MLEEAEETIVTEELIPEEYIEAERRIKEISIIDFNEFIIKTELWHNYLEGRISLKELEKILKKRRAARIRVKEKLASKKTTKKTASKKKTKQKKSKKNKKSKKKSKSK